MTKFDAHAVKRLDQYLESAQEMSRAGLHTLSNHKYRSGVYTPLDLLCYKIWWEPAANLLPVWMAPNLVTFIGFSVVLTNICLFAYLNPTLDEVVPSWAFAYAGTTVLFYVMMDAIDGMQARRTKSSSPLGQLFDHGCDCATTTVFSLMMINGLGVGPCWKAVGLMATVQVAFFLSQWEEKYTGICRTSVGGVFGVTESQLMLAAQMFVSAWNPHIGELLIYEQFTLQDVWFYLYCGFMVFISVLCIFGVVTKAPSSVIELLSILVLNGSILTWAICLGIAKSEYLLVILCLAFCNSFSTIRVILAGISHMSFPLFQPVSFPYYGLFIARLLCGEGLWVQSALTMYLGGLLVHILSALVKVTNEISAYLGIYVFDIVHKRVV